MKKQDVHFRHWSEKDKKAITKVRDFKEMAQIALEIMERMPKGIHAVSGPMTTGGVGSNMGNVEVFQNITEMLAEDKKLNIISWIPFEVKVRDFLAEWFKKNDKDSYCMAILEDFYHTVFSSGKIVKVHFIHGWESSFGASWEHKLCEKLGIERNYLSPEFSQKALKRKTVA